MSPITQVSSNSQGLLALPEDTCETYADRVAALSVGDFPSFAIKAYDINASWVPVEYSNQGLRLWEAGCTWCADSPDIPPTIQLNSHFEHSSTYLGMYDKDEILSHEYVHAVRSCLGSSYFEEIFAYLLSYKSDKGFLGKLASGFRVALGPLFEHAWESLLLVLLSLLTLLFLVANVFIESPMLSLCIAPIAILTLSAAVYFFIRLSLRWWQWYRCKKHLDILVGASSLPLMVRLTDEEIILFSRLKPNKIAEWIHLQAPNFRWQLLTNAYLENMQI